MAVILAADESHLDNTFYDFKKKTKNRHRLALKDTHSPAWVVRHLPHSSSPTHAVWAEPGKMTKLVVFTESTTMGNDGG